jgi:hypothetical protein
VQPFVQVLEALPGIAGALALPEARVAEIAAEMGVA